MVSPDTNFSTSLDNLDTILQRIWSARTLFFKDFGQRVNFGPAWHNSSTRLVSSCTVLQRIWSARTLFFEDFGQPGTYSSTNLFRPDIILQPKCSAQTVFFNEFVQPGNYSSTTLVSLKTIPTYDLPYNGRMVYHWNEMRRRDVPYSTFICDIRLVYF